MLNALAAALAFAPCHLPGLAQQVECATLTVPEARSAARVDTLQAAASDTLDLHIARQPAQGGSAVPLVFLPGGPGQAASDLAPMVLQMLGPAAQSRDLILIDFRGTGRSGALKCDEVAEQLGDDPDAALNAVQACAQSLAAEHDLTQYNSTAIADDLETLRLALGAPQLDLYGGSYGTRAALVYMRRYPASVRAAVLDGVAPIGWPVGGHMSRDAEAALAAVLEACAAQPACAARFEDPRAGLAALLDALDAQPWRAARPHPATGQTITDPVARDDAALALRGVLYSETLSRLIPWQIEQGRSGDLASLMAAGYAFTEGLQDAMSTGMMLSVLCAEDIPSLPPTAPASEQQGFVGDSMWNFFKPACERWPVEPVDAAFYQPAELNTPTLLISGAWDPVTPPQNADDAARYLPNSRHIVALGTAHIAARRGCMPDLIAKFLDTADPAALDTACVDDIRTPQFFTTARGPEIPPAAAAGDKP